VILGLVAAISCQQSLSKTGNANSSVTYEWLTEYIDKRRDPIEYTEADAMISWRSISSLIDGGVPTYYIDKNMADELLATDCTDIKIDWNDFEWPHQSMLIIPPKGLYRNSPLVITIHWSGKTVTAAGVTEHEADYGQKFFMFETGRSGSIGSDAKRVIDACRSAALSRDLSEAEVETSTKFAESTVGLIVNTIMAMVSEPNFEEEDKRRDCLKSTRSASDPGATWNPNFFKLRSTHTSSTHQQHEHGGVRVHPRRGHWRTLWKDANEDSEITVGRRVGLKGHLGSS